LRIARWREHRLTRPALSRAGARILNTWFPAAKRRVQLESNPLLHLNFFCNYAGSGKKGAAVAGGSK